LSTVPERGDGRDDDVMVTLGDLTWTDLEGRRPVLVVPVGSVEQHGPHLPLDTDTRLATAIATAAVARDRRCVLGPTLPIGASGEHAAFPGTLSIGTEALTTLLVELVRSADGFAGTVLVNGHGGNGDALRELQRVAGAEGRTVHVWSPSIADGDAHAGRTETSLLLAIDPSCVRVDAMTAGESAPVMTLLDRLRAEGVRAVSPSGVLGDPTGADATEGARLLENLVDDLVGRLRDWFR